MTTDATTNGHRNDTLTVEKNLTPEGETIKEKLQAQLNPDGTVELTDQVQIAVLCLFIVQKLGKCSATEVRDKAAMLHANLNEHQMSDYLEGLRARGLVSYARGAKSSGENVQKYKIKQAVWNNSLEVAHIIDLLPALVSTPEAQATIALLNDSESEVEGEKKAGRRLGYDEYVDLRIDFILKTPIIGSTPADSPFVRAMVKDSPVESQLPFWREGKYIIIPSDSVRGWLRTAMRTRGSGDVVAGYIGIDDVFIDTTAKDVKVGQVALPVIDPRTKQGKGLNTYEIISSGARISIDFRIPTRGFMSPEDFVTWLAIYAPRPLRGLSPGRGGRFGKLYVVDYKIECKTSDAAAGIECLIDTGDLPEASLGVYAKLLARAKQNNINLRAVGGGVEEESN